MLTKLNSEAQALPAAEDATRVWEILVGDLGQQERTGPTLIVGEGVNEAVEL